MNAQAYRPLTVAQTLARGIVGLAKAGDSPRSDALQLLAFVLGRERSWIVAHGETFLSKPQAEKFAGLCDVRAGGMPLAYILGTVGFYGREFTVNEKVLVPRPETEHLVDEALAHVKARVNPSLPKQFVTVLDVGVGSGAIACTIAAENANVFVEGTDTSSAAIKVAQHNARRLNVIGRCRFHYGSLASPVGDRQYDVVVANLPYVPSADVPRPPESAGFEPREALDGGPDGLAAYRQFLPGAPGLLKPGGMLLLEAAPPVFDELAVLVGRAFPRLDFEVCEDYAGLARYVKLVTPE
ncbi:MAG: peptide chain release factor N(5)-glutamine methyltransferase [Candidatus Eremiobacteraeota bacterium]|nr:peptide chain release factor N(5)-glutamine methyltransferase [Candidatus Eremiobacteraeota bacterium]MBV8333010.1 peptide chain release factor N(5)-glutamine methyltransferase [Candidatus Eremiobacteraeota bacterium]MBV8432901.1 peptide chain release factor N(5)-glutamine methyltransferase [Candidatus Eremiobacteraeota bacterium]MBV8720563.1 peptide chain release factor N(5)-glutamine methyltransferase [Candidatus Eremiobacteraeota bacterium]